MVPSRNTRTGTGRPIRSAAISRWRSRALSIATPSTSRMRSSGRRPASAAGLPGTTSTISTPSFRPTSRAMRGGSGRGPPAIPRYARRNRPSVMSDAMIFRVVALIGTARPSPTPATAVLTPTTRPRPSDRAPPEFPGFNAASVWMTFSTIRLAEPCLVGRARPTALTTPAVTEPGDPSGLPTATTSWPTRSRSASPRVAEVRSVVPTRITAMSESGSVPTISNVASRPSTNDALPPEDPATTWAEVSRNPSGVMTTAEPAPSARPPRRRRRTRRLATEGMSTSATRVTTDEYASRASSSSVRTGPCPSRGAPLRMASTNRGDAMRLRLPELGPLGPDPLHLRERLPQVLQPVLLLRGYQPDAPRQGVAPAPGHPRGHQRVEHRSLGHAQAGHHGDGQRGERGLDVPAHHAPGDLATQAALRLEGDTDAPLPRLFPERLDPRGDRRGALLLGGAFGDLRLGQGADHEDLLAVGCDVRRPGQPAVGDAAGEPAAQFLVSFQVSGMHSDYRITPRHRFVKTVETPRRQDAKTLRLGPGRLRPVRLAIAPEVPPGPSTMTPPWPWPGRRRGGCSAWWTTRSPSGPSSATSGGASCRDSTSATP